MPEDQVASIAKHMWRFNARDFRRTLEEKPELAELAAQVHESQQLDRLVDLTTKLDRLPRHISVHLCSVILSDASLLDRTPVQRSGMGLPMSQYGSGVRARNSFPGNKRLTIPLRIHATLWG
ncbi:hypothetical protein E3N94_11325 [Cryobacterium sp. Sr3]|nr:hypothetical protein E3N94_11325 [Cryobacterium sp. Sr3]